MRDLIQCNSVTIKFVDQAFGAFNREVLLRRFASSGQIKASAMAKKDFVKFSQILCLQNALDHLFIPGTFGRNCPTSFETLVARHRKRVYESLISCGR